MDGLRAQARQAGGAQRAAARRAASRFVADRRRRSRRCRTCRYVITLDTDTQLPRDAARAAGRRRWRTRSTARASTQRAAASSTGYGILQPRVGVEPAERAALAVRAAVRRRRRASIPYTRAVSDVYQDLFGEGSFIGKGIYDVDAFERALDGGFPENRILSHDLLEGALRALGPA